MYAYTVLVCQLALDLELIVSDRLRDSLPNPTLVLFHIPFCSLSLLLISTHTYYSVDILLVPPPIKGILCNKLKVTLPWMRAGISVLQGACGVRSSLKVV